MKAIHGESHRHGIRERLAMIHGGSCTGRQFVDLMRQHARALVSSDITRLLNKAADAVEFEICNVSKMEQACHTTDT